MGTFEKLLEKIFSSTIKKANKEHPEFALSDKVIAKAVSGTFRRDSQELVKLREYGDEYIAISNVAEDYINSGKEKVLSYLSDPRDFYRLAALRLLSDKKAEGSFEALMVCFKDTNHDIHSAALTHLGSSYVKEINSLTTKANFINELVDFINNDKPINYVVDCRRNAIELLGKIARPSDENVVELLRYTSRKGLKFDRLFDRLQWYNGRDDSKIALDKILKKQ